MDGVARLEAHLGQVTGRTDFMDAPGNLVASAAHGRASRRPLQALVKQSSLGAEELNKILTVSTPPTRLDSGCSRDLPLRHFLGHVEDLFQIPR